MKFSNNLDRLAVYGTLAPGQTHHDLLNPFPGRWFKGKVRGRRFIFAGYPALELDPGGSWVPLHILETENIDWDLLDAFEGQNYRRALVRVETEAGVLPCQIYLHANVQEPLKYP